MEWFITFTAWAILPIFCTWCVLYILIRRFRAVERRNPLSRHLLRSAGEGLRKNLDDTTWDLAAYASLVPVAPLIAYGGYVSQLAFAQRPPGTLSAIFLIAFVVATEAGLIRKIHRIVKLRRRLTLGYDAELAVGQELNILAKEGFHVFHDIPATGFNIDHVIVGKGGVFAFETKGRSKPALRSKDGHIVKYDGTTLQFPGWREAKPLQHAVSRAKWLSNWVSGAVGESVAVKPVLVLPGWYVHRTGTFETSVISGGEICRYLQTSKPASPMDSTLVERIAFQLDQRCRDVEPQAYRKDKAAAASA